MAKPHKAPFTSVLYKSDLIREIAQESQDSSKEVLTQKEISYTLDLLEKVIIKSMAQGSKISVMGFIQFEPVYRPARSGRNMIKNQKLEIPEKMTIKISAGSNLKSVVKEYDPVLFKSFRDRYFENNKIESDSKE